MDRIAQASQEERAELFRRSAAILRPERSPAIMEKDLWVCWAWPATSRSRPWLLLWIAAHGDLLPQRPVLQADLDAATASARVPRSSFSRRCSPTAKILENSGGELYMAPPRGKTQFVRLLPWGPGGRESR